MDFPFFKFHGTGNDFIIFDNRDQRLHLSNQQVAQLCHRRFGIGADGLMLLENADGYDFRMVYFNADGKESSMCGNGGRCITAFAKQLGIIGKEARFIAIDGVHTAQIHDDGLVSLKMNDVAGIHTENNHSILNTGSPHYINWVNNIEDAAVVPEGRAIRYAAPFAPDGINVNFVQLKDGKLWVRTYERGVEDETLSCGTGVTAAAIAAQKDNTGTFTTSINTPGGALQVSFTKETAHTATNVILTGPATFVFKGSVAV